MRPESKRCFVAIEIPDRIQAILSEVQSEFRPKIKKASWTRRGNFHLTLKFLGDVEKSSINKINSTIEGIVANHKPFCLEIGGIGTFPNMYRPRVLWAGLTQGARETTTLTNTIIRELMKLGFPNERRFHPHFTLARIRKSVNMKTHTESFKKFETMAGTLMNVNHITLVRSELHPSGASYTPLHIYPLGGRK
jgi:2'-5' RNA ligase